MTFSEPIVAGETILQDLQSEGYTEGVSGWRIERDGDADFNNVDIRGQWTVSGDEADEFITCRVTAGSPILDLSRDGITYRLRAASDATFGERLVIGSTTGATPDISLVDNVGSGSARIAFGPDVTDERAVLFLDGFMQSAVNFTEETWHTLTLASGTGTVQYKLLPDGNVMMRGSQVPAANVAGTDLFTLPVGYRPSQVCRFETSTGDTAAGGRIQITTAGLCEIARAAGTASYWYDGVLFSTL